MPGYVFLTGAIVFIILPLFSCTSYDKPITKTMKKSLSKDDLIELERLHRKDKKAVIEGDIETLLSLCTEDIVLMPSEGPILKGKSAIRKMLYENIKSSKDIEIIEYTHDFKEIKVINDLAYEWGFYKTRARNKEKGTESIETGKILRILKRHTDKSWKVARSIWTADNEKKK